MWLQDLGEEIEIPRLRFQKSFILSLDSHDWLKNGTEQPEDADLCTGGAWHAGGGAGRVHGVQR